MNSTALDILSIAKREAVRPALAAAFGSVPIGAVKPISGGASGAALFRVEVRDRSYLLRVEGQPSPLRNPHQYVSLRLAAEAGLAPRVLHIDDANGVAITDFIAQRPLSEYPGGPRGLAQALGALLRRLQATPVFPYFVDYPDIVSRLFAHVRRTGLFADGLLDAHVERLGRIRDEYNFDPAQLVSSHNDLNARNILFDGERLWLIDWESAYRNDPLVDAAILLDNLAPSRALANVLLRAWLGRAPDAALLVRLEPIRALTRLYYAGVLLSASAALPRNAPDGDLTAPTPKAFRQAMLEGELKAGTPQSIHVAGKMYLSAFLSGGAVPALDAI
jgi:aminoglycoside phosphotransferase (APT) family kinase protein